MAKIGAVLYAAWGLLHIAAAAQEFSLAGELDPGLVQGKLNQGAWNLGFFALASILIAITLNWRNRPLGYWLNLAVVSVADLGFLIFVFIPGYASVIPGVFGPILWLAGAAFTTLGIRKVAPV
ncbi:MAG: hypothetical protein WBR18_10935 [Anaerolineales bacterium]